MNEWMYHSYPTARADEGEADASSRASGRAPRISRSSMAQCAALTLSGCHMDSCTVLLGLPGPAARRATPRTRQRRARPACAAPRPAPGARRRPPQPRARRPPCPPWSRPGAPPAAPPAHVVRAPPSPRHPFVSRVSSRQGRKDEVDAGGAGGDRACGWAAPTEAHAPKSWLASLQVRPRSSFCACNADGRALLRWRSEPPLRVRHGRHRRLQRKVLTPQVTKR